MFGIGGLEQAILDRAVAALAAAGQPVPDDAHVVRYHSDPVVDCCTGTGALFVFWRRASFDRTGLPPNVTNPPGRPVVDLVLRLFRCFPTLHDDGRPPEGADVDAAASGLAVDADVLWASFTDAICTSAFADSTYGCDNFSLVDMTPRAPKGGCAGVELTFRVGWKRWSA